MRKAKGKKKGCSGKYGGTLPDTVRSLAKAYLADYDRRRLIIERGDARGRDEPRFKRINAIVDSSIASVLDMYGIAGSARGVIERDLKSGVGGRSARAVSMEGSFLQRVEYEHIRYDVLWFVARDLKLV